MLMILDPDVFYVKGNVIAMEQPTALFHKVEAKTLRPLIAGEMRAAILNGRLRPGERIVERSLAAQFGASLSVIREALVELEIEGFIMKRRNTASYVTRVTLEDAQKVFALRAVLEPYAIAQAAKLATPGQITELGRICERMHECARNHDTSGYLREDYAFHDFAWQMGDNEYVRSALARALVPLYAFSAIRWQEEPFDLLADAAGHLLILNALAANDAAAAEAAVRAGMAQWQTRPPSYADPAEGGK